MFKFRFFTFVLSLSLSSFAFGNDMQMAICAKVIEHFEGTERAVPIVEYLASTGTPREHILGYMEAAETIIQTDPQKARDVYENTCKKVAEYVN